MTPVPRTRFSPIPRRSDGKVYAVLKNWGTTGFVVNTKKITSGPKSWKDFFDVTMGEGSGHTIVHDYQLTTIGAALCALGYSFNSIDEGELAAAEKLLIDVETASVCDYLGLSAGYAQRRWVDVDLLEWRWPATQQADMPEMEYVIASTTVARSGRTSIAFQRMPHIWKRPIPSSTSCWTPIIQVREFASHGYATGDSRVEAMLPANTADNDDPVPGQGVDERLGVRRRTDADRSDSGGSDCPLQVCLISGKVTENDGDSSAVLAAIEGTGLRRRF